MSGLNIVVSIVRAVYSLFFAWMPVSMQVLVGGIIAVAALYLVIKVVGAILAAIPFL